MASTRQLAAIMFTDMVGYTALMGEDEQRAFDVLVQNRQLQKPLIEQHGGRWIKELGDGVLASFSTVTDAVLCAVAIQKACNENHDFKLRIGIHQGEVVFEDDDVFGDGVNIASRIQALAPIGGTWISEAVYKNISNKKEIKTRFVRTERLKHVKEPVSIYEIIATEYAVKAPTSSSNKGSTGTAFFNQLSKRNRRWIFLISILVFLSLLIGLSYWFYSQGSSKQIQSIAVLPFVNESSNADLEYLSDGMTEMLISSLSQLPDVDVKARSSVFRYKGKKTDVSTIGKELQVQAILNGTVVRRGQDLALHIELVNAQKETVLWSADYKQPISNLISLQREATQDVVQKLKLKLSGVEEQRLAKNYTANSNAYQLYLKGRYHWGKLTRKDIEKAIEYFQQAIDLDSNYALAYTGLVDAYDVVLGGRLPAERIAKLRKAAQKAVLLDDNLAEAHTALGFVLLRYDFDFAGAEQEYRRAIELNPNYATAHHRYGELLIKQGRWEEGFNEFRRALEIEPVNIIFNAAYGLSMIYARQYDKAIAQLKKTQELDSSLILIHSALSFVYQLKGQYGKSIEERVKFFELFGETQVAALEREAYAKGGWQGYLGTMTGANKPANQPFYLDAIFYVFLGEKNKALTALNQAYENHEIALLNLKVDPRLDPLRSDPRFVALLRQIGFKE